MSFKTESSFTVVGSPRIVLRDCDGNVKLDVTIPNMVVTTGKAFLASRAVGTGATVMSHMAIGSGATAPIAAETSLGAELGGAALISSTAVNNTITYVANFGAGIGTGAVTEAGIFNDVTSGDMLNRATFPVINKGVSDTMTITWNITIN